MFRWANKQRLSSKKSIEKAKSQQTERSYPSSPAHSTVTVDYINFSEKANRKKIVLKSRKKDSRTDHKVLCDHDWNNTSKTDLLKLINQRKDRQFEGSPILAATQVKKERDDVVRRLFANEESLSQERSENTFQHWKQMGRTKKSVISIAVTTNHLLPEFVHAYEDVHSKQWNIFAMATVLLRMGFIKDLVHDRETVKLIWKDLYLPDPLILYIFMEKVMNGRVQVLEAAEKLAIKDTQFVLLWEKKVSFSPDLTAIMGQLRSNRSARKQ